MSYKLVKSHKNRPKIKKKIDKKTWIGDCQIFKMIPNDPRSKTRLV